MSEQTSLEDALGLEAVREDGEQTEQVQAVEEPEAETQEADATEADAEGEGESGSEEGREQASEDQPKSVPHERFHAELQRRKEVEAELEKLRQAKPKTAPDLSHLFADEADDLPDPVDDPQGYNRAIEQRFSQRLARERFQTSRTFADQVHGPEAVEEALNAFSEASKANPLLKQAAETSPNPVGEIVGWYKQQQFWARVQEAGGPEAYEKQLREAAAAERLAQEQPAPQASPSQPKPQAQPSDFATSRNAAPRDGGFSPADLGGLLNN